MNPAARVCNTTAKMAQQTVDTYAIGEKDQAAAIEKFGVYEWCRRTLQYRVDISKIPPELGELASLEGYDYGIHFLAPERCVKALREFLAEQKR